MDLDDGSKHVPLFNVRFRVFFKASDVGGVCF